MFKKNTVEIVKDKTDDKLWRDKIEMNRERA